MLRRDVHLNLVQSSRQLFQLDPGAEVDSGAGWVFGAGRSSHPVISNAAFRTDDELDPDEFLDLGRDFFAARDRGFAVWARSGVPEDEGLMAAAQAAGLDSVYEMPEMVLRARADERPLPEGVELRRVESRGDADEYWQVATGAYASLGFPPEIFAFYEEHGGLLADNVAAFIAYLDERPVSIAMTIVSHGIAGIYWVGSLEEARGKGLGWALTAAAANAGLDLGGGIVSLQASPMGEGLYAAMGFESIFTYRLLLCPSTKSDGR